MEFDKSRVFTALNADELRAGDKVICANNLTNLKAFVEDGIVNTLGGILSEKNDERFDLGDCAFALAYLVERKENCTNCDNYEECGYMQATSRFASLNRCEDYKPKAEPKTTEKKYRPFRDCDELIKVWDEKYRNAYGLERINNGLDMPLIWVQVKKNGRRFALAELDERILGYLFSDCTFLDGSVCGVVENE